MKPDSQAKYVKPYFVGKLYFFWWQLVIEIEADLLGNVHTNIL